MIFDLLFVYLSNNFAWIGPFLPGVFRVCAIFAERWKSGVSGFVVFDRKEVLWI